MPGYAKHILKKYKEGGKVEEYKSDLMKEVEGMGPEGKRYLKDKLQGKKYEGKLSDEYKHDLDKELEGMSEKGKEDLKKLLGIDDDPWKDVKKELNEPEETIGEKMAYSEDGYAKGGEVEDVDMYTERYISTLTPEQRREAALDEKFKLLGKESKKMGPKKGFRAWRPDQEKIEEIDKKYGVDELDQQEADKHLDDFAKSAEMKGIIDRERKIKKAKEKDFAKGGAVHHPVKAEPKDVLRTKKDKDWIQDAVKKPGALRAVAKKEKLIKGDEKISGSDLKKLAAMAKKKKDKKLAKRVNLAETFAKMRKS